MNFQQGCQNLNLHLQIILNESIKDYLFIYFNEILIFKNVKICRCSLEDVICIFVIKK